MINRDKEIKDYFYKLDRSFYMDNHKESANLDIPIPIGHGQTISQPSLVLKMTLALNLQPDDIILEIGTGSGFQTALLAAFSKEVYTIERIEELQQRAKEKLKKAKFTNIFYKIDDGSLGWREQAPFDRIIVTAAASKVPDELLAQLKEGGKMVIPIGSSVSQELRMYEKNEEGKISFSFIEHVLFVRLRGKYD